MMCAMKDVAAVTYYYTFVYVKSVLTKTETEHVKISKPLDG